MGSGSDRRMGEEDDQEVSKSSQPAVLCQARVANAAEHG